MQFRLLNLHPLNRCVASGYELVMVTNQAKTIVIS